MAGISGGYLSNDMSNEIKILDCQLVAIQRSDDFVLAWPISDDN